MNAPVPIRAFTPEEREELEREAEWEALRADVRDEFLQHHDDDTDFSDWLIRMAQPHIRDWAKYREALNYSERQAFERNERMWGRA